VSFDLGWALVAELLALGAIAGFLAGLLGVGGGAMLVPFMTLVFSVRAVPEAHIVKMAIATSLATVCFTSVSSVRAHHHRGAVRWKLVGLMAPGIVVGGLVGAQVAKALTSNLLALVFAVFIGHSALQIFMDKKPKPTRQLPSETGLIAFGGGVGLLSTLVGAGGAFVSVPFMLACNVPIIHAVGTSAALGFPIALAGTTGYVIAGWSQPGMPAGTLGFVYLPALLALASASVLTAPLGARSAHTLPVRQLKRVFACLLCAMSGYMLYKAFRL
jgi:uncharacterized membrane protein YfcA